MAINPTIGQFTAAMLLTMERITLDSNVPDNEIKNLYFLPDGAMIELSNDKNISEETYLKNVLNILNKANTLNKPLKFCFSVEKRSILKRLGFNRTTYKNLSLMIKSDMLNYRFNEYAEEEAKLDSLVASIDESLSPFEKFIAVFNIVKNFKPYKENKNEPAKARYLKYILNNKYIVCLGYSKLLVTLLDRVGINACELSVIVDDSYDKGFSVENIPVEEVGHSRVLINIDDNKYDVHGLYTSDPTWDNDSAKDYYNHSLMTFDMEEKEKRLFWLSDEDLIYNVHDFEEFNQKINFYLERKMRYYRAAPNFLYPDKDDTSTYYIACDALKEKLKQTIGQIDENFQAIINKYNFSNKEAYGDFFTEIGHYIVSRTNHHIKGENIIESAKTVFEKVDKLNPTEVLEREKKAITDSNEYEKLKFPYQIPSEDDSFRLEENTIERFHAK